MFIILIPAKNPGCIFLQGRFMELYMRTYSSCPNIDIKIKIIVQQIKENSSKALFNRWLGIYTIKIVPLCLKKLHFPTEKEKNPFAQCPLGQVFVMCAACKCVKLEH